MDGYQELVAAHQALEGSDDPRERLRSAADSFWKALLYEPSWPEPLRRRAARLIEGLFDHGPIKTTVSRMTPQQTQAMLKELEAFVTEFLRSNGH